MHMRGKNFLVAILLCLVLAFRRLQGYVARKQPNLCFDCRIFRLSICSKQHDLPGMNLSVEQKMVLFVNGNHCIPEQKCVDGDTFMHLKKWDRALVKTLTGKSLDLRSGRNNGTLNIDMWDEMLRARQGKANELLQEAFNVEDDNNKPIERKKSKKLEVVKALSKHALVLPKKFTISVREHDFQVLFDGIGTKSLWIEMSEANLTWLKSAIDTSEQKPRKKRKTRRTGEKVPKSDDEDDDKNDHDHEKNDDDSSEGK